MRLFSSIMLFAIILVYTSDAKPFRVNQIPNGSKFGCANCHVSAAGGGALTPFGDDVNEYLVDGNVDWSNIMLAFSDSDGDLFPNAVELSDPMQEWQIGDPDPGVLSEVSNPGDATSVPDINSVGNDFSENEIFVTPNPADQDVQIHFNIKEIGEVSIKIMDLNGRVINTLATANSQTIIVAWDRRNSTGDLVTPGIYFIYIRVGTKEAIRKVIIQ
jgi:hypothetical protein